MYSFRVLLVAVLLAIASPALASEGGPCDYLRLSIKNVHHYGERLLFVHGDIDPSMEGSAALITFSEEHSLSVIESYGLDEVKYAGGVLEVEPANYTKSFGIVFRKAEKGRVYVSEVLLDGTECDIEEMKVPAHLYWSYVGSTGAHVWETLGFTDCGPDNMYQSPINLPSNRATKTDTKLEVSHPEATYTVKQSHGSPVFGCAEEASCGYITYNGVKYDLLQFHLHSYSENALDGVLSVMEAHFVHFRIDENGDVKLLVLGLFITTAPGHNPGLDKFWTADSLSAEKGEFTVDPAADLYGPSIAAGSKLFEFQGSLTTPPCSGGVQWLLLEKPAQMSFAQYAMYRNVVDKDAPMGNYRPHQPINGREIGYIEF